MTGREALVQAVVGVGQMTYGQHLCLLFDNETERQSVMSTFVRDGLTAGDKVTYFADAPTPRDVLSFLERHDVACWTAVAAGQLTVLDADKAYLPSGGFDPAAMLARVNNEICAAKTAGYPGLRITGDVGWTLSGGPGSERFCQFEHDVNSLFVGEPVMAICQYDRRRFPPDALEQYKGAHPGAVSVNDYYHDGVLRITPTFAPPGLRVHGEIDLRTVSAWDDALRTRLLQSDAIDADRIELDLSGLTFIDLDGIRVIFGYAKGLPPGQRLVLTDLARYLHRMFEVSGWDALPGLAFDWRTS